MATKPPVRSSARPAVLFAFFASLYGQPQRGDFPPPRQGDRRSPDPQFVKWNRSALRQQTDPPAPPEPRCGCL